MVHTVYRISAIPDRVKKNKKDCQETERLFTLARRLRDGSCSVQYTCHTIQG
jgi:hypothetical protein